MKEKHWQALSWVTRKSNKLSSDAVALDGEKDLLLKPSLRFFERKTLGVWERDGISVDPTDCAKTVRSPSNR